MTRRRGIAVILCVAVCAGFGAHLAWRAVEKVHKRHEQARMTGNDVRTNSAPLAPSGMYLGTNKLVFANFGTQDPALQAYIKALMDGSYDTRAKGRAIFIKICAACHQPDGMGKDGVGPPLVGSEWVLAADGNRLVRIVLNGVSGPIQVEGRQWNLVMPPWRENLRDDQIAVVLNYIRSNLGTNKAGPIRQELVSAAREESHPKPETAEELLEISE
jgi:mono/diheme cytochrome c family protein